MISIVCYFRQTSVHFQIHDPSLSTYVFLTAIKVKYTTGHPMWDPTTPCGTQPPHVGYNHPMWDTTTPCGTQPPHVGHNHPMWDTTTPCGTQPPHVGPNHPMWDTTTPCGTQPATPCGTLQEYWVYKCGLSMCRLHTIMSYYQHNGASVFWYMQYWNCTDTLDLLETLVMECKMFTKSILAISKNLYV